MDWALELAENANAYTPLGEEDVRVFGDRFVLWMGRGSQPGWNVAQRFRLRAEDVEPVRAEIHELLRARGRTRCSWEVGSHATPPDLVDRLYALGLVDDAPDPLAVGMVLRREPPAAPPDVEVRRAETREELLAAERIAATAFGEEVEDRDPPAASTVKPIYLAYVDGEPVARASASFSEHGVTLFGGATLPEARGRGAYRALVAARWRDAAARGTPLLVTQAGRMSRPILARLGFREVCEIRILVDRFAEQE
jgi:GNAT superfamily N-acetyltransferase